MWIAESRCHLVRSCSFHSPCPTNICPSSYLNALIQTLLFTTEFRGRWRNSRSEMSVIGVYTKWIFSSRTSVSSHTERSKSSSELQWSESNSVQWIDFESKLLWMFSRRNTDFLPWQQVRKIIVELQRLFAEMLLLNQEACSSIRLTDSFGWQSNEVRPLRSRGWSALIEEISSPGYRSSRCARTESFTVRCHPKISPRNKTVQSDPFVLRRIDYQLYSMQAMPKHIQTLGNCRFPSSCTRDQWDSFVGRLPWFALGRTR